MFSVVVILKGSLPDRTARDDAMRFSPYYDEPNVKLLRTGKVETAEDKGEVEQAREKEATGEDATCHEDRSGVRS